jgi:hypothetical protein
MRAGRTNGTGNGELSKLPAPVAEFLSVPMEEAEIIEVNMHSTRLNILP